MYMEQGKDMNGNIRLWVCPAVLTITMGIAGPADADVEIHPPNFPDDNFLQYKEGCL